MIPCPKIPVEFNESETIYFRLPRVRDRFDLTADLISGQRVLHFGCCDHLPLIEPKMRAGEWFHDLILSKASDALGVDVDDAALEACRHLRPEAAFVRWDVFADEIPEQLTTKHWDWCLLPEIIEHLDNPVAFLSTLRGQLLGRCDKLLCTVPNAFLLGNLYSAVRSREIVNTDHRHWYTPFTILKVLSRAGYGNFQMCALRYGRKPGIKGVVKRSVEKFFPLMATGLAVSADFNGDVDDR